jgi:hypothetical protein
VRYNELGDEGKQALRDAVKEYKEYKADAVNGRDGFELIM